MEVLAGRAPYLSEWNLQRYTAVPLRGCVSSVLLRSVSFFSQLVFQCVSVIKGWLALFRRAQYELPLLELAVDPRWPLGTVVKANQVWIWNSRTQPSVLICNCVQPRPAILHLLICTPPPPNLSGSVRRAAVGQNTPRTQLMHSTWIKDLVAGHSARDMLHRC